MTPLKTRLKECRGSFDDAIEAMKIGYTVQRNLMNADLYRIYSAYLSPPDSWLYMKGEMVKQIWCPEKVIIYEEFTDEERNATDWTVWPFEML